MAISKENLIAWTKLPITSETNLRTVIKEYNLIITTPFNTIDTSNYNLVQESTTLPANYTEIFANSGTGKSIALAYNNAGSKKLTALTNKDNIVIIPLSTITSIKIKSQRNFLKNQEEIKLKA